MENGKERFGLFSLGLFQKLPKKEKCFFFLVTFHFVHTEGNTTPKCLSFFLTSLHKMNYLQHIQLVGGGTKSLPIGEKVDYLMCVFAPTQQHLAPQ